jgi:hypothetical protein
MIIVMSYRKAYPGDVSDEECVLVAPYLVYGDGEL